MAETPSIRFGILGCADIAIKLSRAISLSPNTTLHAIGSRSIDKARCFAESNGFPSSVKLYGSYDEVLDDPDVDAVYVPLPTSLHPDWAVRAADKNKHVLLEKPTALNVAQLDLILAACQANGVQFMDSTMWMHHPRTSRMEEFLSDSHCFGKLNAVQASFCYAGDFEFPGFLENNIRVRSNLDALGALGDQGWYCIRAILWAANYELPKSVTAFRNPIKNEAGVILSCGASLHWEDGTVGTLYCSFLSNAIMDITASGTKGTLHVNDFVIPYEENVASFSTVSEARITELNQRKWSKKPSEHFVNTDLPQEALMVKEFSTLVDHVKRHGSAPDMKWPTLSRKTQLVLDAVVASIDKGFAPVEIQANCSFAADSDFLENDIRVRPDLDALGALGDVGWYCIRGSLFAANYELPKFVTALRNPVKNKAGVILSCGASLHWENGTVGTFYCSFLSNLTMDITAIGTKGTLHVTDFIIPHKENVATFSTVSEAWFTDMDLEWNKEPSEHIVHTDLPQEVLMVKEFSALVDGIKRHGLAPEKLWPTLSRKTQLVIDGVVASIDKGFEPVEITC